MADLVTDHELELRMSREEYRRWAEAQPKGRFERVDGAVVAMAPERAGHNENELARQKSLLGLLATMTPLEENFPPIADPPPGRVSF